MVWKGRETALGFALASHWGALGDILNISVKYSSLSKDKRSAEPSPFERILKDESVGVNDPEFPADSIWAFTGHYFKWFWDVISLDATILSDNYCRFILVFRRSSLTNGSLITTKYPVHYPAWIPLFFFFIQTNQHLKKNHLSLSINFKTKSIFSWYHISCKCSGLMICHEHVYLSVSLCHH